MKPTLRTNAFIATALAAVFALLSTGAALPSPPEPRSAQAVSAYAGLVLTVLEGAGAQVSATEVAKIEAIGSLLDQALASFLSAPHEANSEDPCTDGGSCTVTTEVCVADDGGCGGYSVDCDDGGSCDDSHDVDNSVYYDNSVDAGNNNTFCNGNGFQHNINVGDGYICAVVVQNEICINGACEYPTQPGTESPASAPADDVGSLADAPPPPQDIYVGLVKNCELEPCSWVFIPPIPPPPQG